MAKHLKENIEVDITNLELHGNIRVEDVKAKEPNYEILNSPRIPIASVVTTRLLKIEESTTPAAAATTPTAATTTPAAAKTPAPKK